MLAGQFGAVFDHEAVGWIRFMQEIPESLALQLFEFGIDVQYLCFRADR